MIRCKVCEAAETDTMGLASVADADDMESEDAIDSELFVLLWWVVLLPVSLLLPLLHCAAVVVVMVDGLQYCSNDGSFHISSSVLIRPSKSSIQDHTQSIAKRDTISCR